jgi:hypothetical protein
MKYCRVSRRQFLQGAGGFTLSLPFLTSLMPSEAQAQSATLPKFLIHFSSGHGGLHPDNWRPNIANYQWASSEQTEIFSGSEMAGVRHVIRHKPLSQLLSNGQISAIFNSNFTPLLTKMNLIEGFGLPYGGGHHQGGFLGNFHGNDGRDFRTGIDSNLLYTPPLETIDQVLARSANFYGAADPRTMPLLNLGGGGQSPSFRKFNGSIQPTTHVWSIQEIYNYIFGGAAGQQAAQSRIGVVNKVFADYQRLRSPVAMGSRISSEDASAVSQHMDSLADVERRLQNITQAASCSAIGVSNTNYGPTNPNSNQNAFQQATRQLFAQQWSIYIDLIVTAINCGLCRIFTIPLGVPTDYTADYHQDIAHRWDLASVQPVIRDAHQYMANYFILPMLQRLNDIAVPGGQRLLDRGVVLWQPESWYATHDGHNLPMMMAGSAGGFFRTGYFLDYRNLRNRGLQSAAWDWQTQSINQAHPYALHYPGLPMNRWLHTLLEGLGMSRTEYLAQANLPAGTVMYGYGDHTVGSWGTQLTFMNTIGSMSQQVTHYAWPSHVLQSSNQRLPFITV